MTRLYVAGAPIEGLNVAVHEWLANRRRIVEHKTPAAFRLVRDAYDVAVADLQHDSGLGLVESHRTVLSNLTDLLLGLDLRSELAERLSSESINELGFRTALAQGSAKNAGENFVNCIVYGLSACLAGQDEILVDKGMPAPIRSSLTLGRRFHGRNKGTSRDIDIKIESDLAIWSRNDPTRAIVVSAKTRLKEIFHIGVMWKMLFDSIGDQYLMSKWDLTGPDAAPDMQMVFATADMIPRGGVKTQGPDVERDQVRNLIAMDASFFDYVFVSKAGISHVSRQLNLIAGREALFHELGCIIDLIEQQFDIALT